MAKKDKVEVNGKMLTQKEKFVYDFIIAKGSNVSARELESEEMSFRSAVATLAYLDTKQNLLEKELVIDQETKKAITTYKAI